MIVLGAGGLLKFIFVSLKYLIVRNGGNLMTCDKKCRGAVKECVFTVGKNRNFVFTLLK